MNNAICGIENIVTKLWDEYSVKEYRPIPFLGMELGSDFPVWFGPV